MDVDYKKIGLMVGMEFHQRLNSDRKLFCSCPPFPFSADSTPKEDLRIQRRQRAIASELGEVDRAALYEYFRKREFNYFYYGKKCCMVETDCDFPKAIDPNALETALLLCKIFNLIVPDELQVMRKIVVDGSSTSGYQRTVMVGVGSKDSFIETSEGKVRIKELELEEESSGIIGEEGGVVRYRLDRLGIPLVEASTDSSIHSPKQAKEVAEKLGGIFRSTGRVQRGIGTIRQDVNISIAGGERVEVKGFQELELIDKLVELEVERQLSLLSIKDELNSRKASVSEEVHEVTSVFEKSENKIIKHSLETGGKVYALFLKGFSGLLKKRISGERTLGRELADYAVVQGTKGMIHSDEPEEKHLLLREFHELRKQFHASETDCVVLFAGREEALRAANSVKHRASQCLKGLPKETRAANPDATTRYLRPLPGSARMYPESDLLPISISPKTIEALPLPLTPEKRFLHYQEIGLSRELAEKMLSSPLFPEFESLVNETKADPTVIASTLLDSLTSLRREGFSVDDLPRKTIAEILFLYSEKKITKSGINELLKHASMGENPEEAVMKHNLEKFGEEKLMDLIQGEEFKGNRKEKAFAEIMRVHRLNVDASELSKLLCLASK